GPNWIGLTKALATTTSFSRLAASTRLRWPACSAPIVGTRPIDFPSWRHRRDASSIAPGVSITTRPLSGAVLDLFAVLCRCRTAGRVLVLQHDAERASLLEGFGVGQDLRRLCVRLALHLESAHLVDELRRQPDVAHDGNSELGQAPRDLDHPAAALELDRMHAGLLHEPA